LNTGNYIFARWELGRLGWTRNSLVRFVQCMAIATEHSQVFAALLAQAFIGSMMSIKGDCGPWAIAHLAPIAGAPLGRVCTLAPFRRLHIGGIVNTHGHLTVTQIDSDVAAVQGAVKVSEHSIIMTFRGSQGYGRIR